MSTLNRFRNTILAQGAWGAVLHGQYDTDETTIKLEANGLIVKRAVAVNPASIASGAEGSITATVTGAQVGMGVLATLTDDVTVGLYLRSAKVTAVNTVTFFFANTSGGAIDEGAVNVTVMLFPGDLN